MAKHLPFIFLLLSTQLLSAYVTQTKPNLPTGQRNRVEDYFSIPCEQAFTTEAAVDPYAKIFQPDRTAFVKQNPKVYQQVLALQKQHRDLTDPDARREVLTNIPDTQLSTLLQMSVMHRNMIAADLMKIAAAMDPLSRLRDIIEGSAFEFAVSEENAAASPFRKRKSYKKYLGAVERAGNEIFDPRKDEHWRILADGGFFKANGEWGELMTAFNLGRVLRTKAPAEVYDRNNLLTQTLRDKEIDIVFDGGGAICLGEIKNVRKPMDTGDPIFSTAQQQLHDLRAMTRPYEELRQVFHDEEKVYLIVIGGITQRAADEILANGFFLIAEIVP